jgi:hypothetical protein
MMSDVRKLLLFSSAAAVIAGMHDWPPVMVEMSKPKPPQPKGPTTKRAKVKAARKQRSKP